MKHRPLILSFGFALFLSGPMLWADGDVVTPPDAPESYTQPNQQPVNNPLPLLAPAKELDKAGIYSEGGRLFLDRNVQIGTLSVSSLTVISSATIPNGKVSTDAAAFGQVKIVQTATGSSTTNATTTSISFVDSQLSAVITPLSASDKVLIIACTSLEVDGSLKNGIATLANGTTNLLGANGQAICQSGSGTTVTTCPACLVFVDSPASTSQQTYKVRYRSTDGVTTVQDPGNPSSTQFMFLAEIQP